MYTGTMIDKLINAVRRAEEQAKHSEVELPELEFQTPPAFFIEMSYTDHRIGVA